MKTPENSLVAAREIVEAARPGASIPPVDCTGDCGYAPCNCSGKWRVQAWSIDLAALREALGMEPMDDE